MSPSARRSERLLLRVVGDAHAAQGLLGDLREEAARASHGRLRYDLTVLGTALSYLFRRSADGRAFGVRDALHDVGAAGRTLRRRPGYVGSVIGTLALGFGAAMAVLSVAYGVWWRPLPFDDPDSLVRVYELRLPEEVADAADEIERRSRMSPPLLHDLRSSEWTAFTGFASVSGLAVDWRRDDERRRLSGTIASRGVFTVLGLRPLAGRFFSREEGVPEVVLSAGLWRSAFGANPDVVGSETMVLDGVPHRVVGVAPDGLPYPESAGDIWVPSDPDASQLTEGMRGARYLDVIARVQDGATIPAAAREVDAFVRNLGPDHPIHQGWGGSVAALHTDLVRPFRGTLTLLATAAALFLLIASANAGSLLAARRSREFHERTVRAALGASRTRLLWFDAAEMLWLALAAAAGATVVAGWALAPLRQLAPTDLPRIAEISLVPVVVLGLSFLLVLAGQGVALVGGLVPERSGPLPGGVRNATRKTRGRTVLTVFQVAMTTVLLLGGAALGQRFQDLASADAGFSPDGVMTAPLVLGEEAYPDDPSRLRFFEAVVDALETRGHRAAVATNPPVAGTNMRFGFRVGGWEGEQYWGQYHAVTSAYFDLMRIPRVAGRVFGREDIAESAPVVIINEALANEHFGDDAVGKELLVVGTVREVIGVVGSVHHFGPDQAPPPQMYVPLPQNPWSLGHVLISPGEGFSSTLLREVVADLDPTVPVDALFPYEQFVRTWFAPLRFQLTVVSMLAGAGTVLAILGLYALVAYVVAGRTREIGVRVALGETGRSIFRRVVGRGLVLALSGLSVGLMVAFSLRGIVSALGVDIVLESPQVLAIVVAAVLAATILACVRPARAASRVDPATALRHS